MWVSRVRRIGLLLVVTLLAAIIATQLITNVGRATVHSPPGWSHVAEPSPSPTPPPDHNNWTGDPNDW